jgi:RNA polymerase sigma factor (sigma-70 family)
MPHALSTRASLLLRLSDPQNHEAWVEFVTLYEPIIYRILRQHGLQDADARDVMQELLLVVSRNIDRWQPKYAHGSFRGWLRRVTRNLIIQWLKRRGREAVSRGNCNLEELLELAPSTGDADSIEFDLGVHRALFQRASQQVRGQIRPTTWEAFWETVVLGNSPADTAAKLNMSVSTVRVAKCRVLARVRAVVAAWEEIK